MKLTIDGKEYNLNITKATELGVLELIKPPVFYHVGQRFYQRWNKEVYILAKIDENEVILISLTDGKLWSGPCMVTNPDLISEAEFKKVSANDKDFKPVVE